MSSFFGQDPQKPAPQPGQQPGTPAPTSAPGTGAPQTAAPKPAAPGGPAGWTNIGTFLGAQTQGERGSVTAGAANAANTAAQNTNQAANNAAATQGAAIAGGTNTGNVRAVDSGNGYQTTDNSKQNLNAYSGPTRSDIAGVVNPQALQTANAPAMAVSQNPYDNAVARTGPGWSNLRQAVGAQNQAAQNAAATSGSLQEQASNAATRSAQNIDAQRATTAGVAAHNEQARQDAYAAYQKQQQAKADAAYDASVKQPLTNVNTWLHAPKTQVTRPANGPVNNAEDLNERMRNSNMRGR